MDNERAVQGDGGPIVQIHDFVHSRLVDAGLLIFGESDRVHRLTGPLAATAASVVDFLRSPRSEADLAEAFAEHSEEDLREILRTFDDLALVKWSPRGSGLTEDQLASHRLLVNHFAASSHPSEVTQRTREVLETSAAIIGIGLLGTRIATSLACAGVGSLRIKGEDADISDEDRRTKPIYAQAPRGSTRMEFLAAQLPRQFPTCDFTFSDRAHGEPEEDVGINVLASDVYDDSSYRTANDRAIETGIAWLLCAFSKGTGVLLSFRPNEGACYACYRARINGNVADPGLFEHELEVRSLLSEVQAAFLPTVDVIAGVAAHEVLTLLPYLPQWSQELFHRRRLAVSDYDYESSQRRLVAPEPLTWSSEVLIGGSPLAIERHPVVRLPRCPACGTTKSRRVPTTPWVMPL